jgi:CheY-like chemotaxis protein
MTRKVILLVEDNPDEQVLTQMALNKIEQAHEVVVVNDGVEALDYLFGVGTYAGRDPAIAPHLILLDLKLPRLDGLEVLRRMRSDPRTALLPVVVLTTSNEDQDLIDSYRLGANSYVCKPVDFGQFVQAVHQLGRYWLVWNEIPPVQVGWENSENPE